MPRPTFHCSSTFFGLFYFNPPFSLLWKLLQAGRSNRLRRLCERKPSGKLLVPESVHEDFMAGGLRRTALLDFLETDCKGDRENKLRYLKKILVLWVLVC